MGCDISRDTRRFGTGAKQAPFEMRGAGMRRVGTKAQGRVGKKANGSAPPLQKMGPSKAAADAALVARMNHL